MADKILTYYIALTDEQVVKEQQQKRHPRYDGRIHSTPGVLFFAPPGDHVGMTYASGPIRGWTQPTGPGPYVWSPFFDPTAGGKDGAFPTDVATFTRKAGGFWGWLGFGTTRFYWAGQFVYVPGDELPGDPEDPGGPENPVPPPETPIEQRRWIDGFETLAGGSGGTGNLTEGSVATDAARHMGGYGLAIRNHTSSLTHTHAANEFGLANSAWDWEKLYVRPRKNPSGGTGRFWKMEMANGSSGAGISLELMPTGAIAIYAFTGPATSTLIGATSTPLDIGRWYRLQMVYQCPPIGGTGVTATDGVFQLYIDGRVAFTGAIPASLINHLSAGTHSSSIVGSTSSNFGMEIDLDDWICVAGEPLKTSKDWRHGSAIIPIIPSGFGSGHNAAGWPGDFRVLGQRLVASSGTDIWLTSNVALSRLEVETDADYLVDALAGSLGIVAMSVGIFGTRGSTSGTLGYSMAGGADVLTAILQNVIAGWTSILFTVNGVTDPINPVAPLKLIHVKGNDASNATTYCIIASAECIGQFGPEDSTEELATSSPLGIHNWPYPGSPWTVRGADPPISPVAIYHGAYVGNGLATGVGGLDLEFPVPIHWLFIRPVAATASGTSWWSTMISAHAANTQATKPAAIPVQYINPDYVTVDAEDTQQMQVKIRISSPNAQINQNGVTYQYIAFADPGQRFMLNGAISHRSTATFINELINGNFLADAAWFMAESLGGAGTIQKFFKGPGNTTAGYNKVTEAETANAVTVALGELTTQSAFHQALNQVAFCLMRKHDGSDDPGVHDVFAMGTYVGDGSASRTIGVSPASTKSPLYVHVQSRTAPGGGIYRDPSHTGTTSQNASGASNASTGIIAGDISSFTVGSALNTSTQVYSYFVLWGSANPGGWTPAPVPGNPPIEIIPVEPDVPVDPGPYPVTPDPGEDPGLDPNPDPEPIEQPPDLSDDLEACPVETHRFCNLALSRVGVSQQVTDLSVDEDGIPAENSQEAVQLRLHYSEAIRATLRDFPWPFATKYAELTLLEGTVNAPVNGDWTFAYRQPGDSVFDRRIVTERNGAIDPTPPPFGHGVDEDGGVIYANEPDAELEYTVRPRCVAVLGDALFVDAALWRLAAAIAPALSRMTDKVDYCMGQYDKAIQKAELVIKPGNPGARDSDPFAGDEGAGCMDANVAVANLALVQLGAKTITSLQTDQSREALTVRLVFEQQLRATLREFPWPWATRYDSALTLVEGTLEDPANADWTYAFRVPAEAIYARRLVLEGTGRGYEEAPFPFRRGGDAIGGIIYTNEEEPILEYTIRPDCAVMMADDLFREALSWRLAFTMAASLVQAEPDKPEQHGRGPEGVTRDRLSASGKASLRKQAQATAWAMYRDTLERAKVAAANEAQRDLDEPDAPWITGR